jgi:hypothetical protein
VRNNEKEPFRITVMYRPSGHNVDGRTVPE